MNRNQWVRICAATLAVATLGGCARIASAPQPSEPGIVISTAPTINTPVADAHTVTWNGEIDFAGFNANNPASTGYDLSTDEVRIGGDNAHPNYYGLLRVPLAGDFFANEVDEAKLFLKMVSGIAPSALTIEQVSDQWSPAFVSSTEAEQLGDPETAVSVPVTAEADGWISVPVTAEVKTWLTGALENNGLMLSDPQGTADFAFSTGNADPAFSPYLEVTGTVSARPTNYGKFPYTEAVATTEDTSVTPNCMAYALRETMPIFEDDLGFDQAEIAQITAAEGIDAAAEHTANLVENYVDSHKNELQISNFRRLDSVNSPIDTDKEYRIALRVGQSPIRDDQFDFHFWAQTNDGRWAQKFPGFTSMIIPGTSGTTAPEDFKWQASPGWGNEKTMNFYKSKVIYFAVTKDAPDFTTAATTVG